MKLIANSQRDVSMFQYLDALLFVPVFIISFAGRVREKRLWGTGNRVSPFKNVSLVPWAPPVGLHKRVAS